MRRVFSQLKRTPVSFIVLGVNTHLQNGLDMGGVDIIRMILKQPLTPANELGHTLGFRRLPLHLFDGSFQIFKQLGLQPADQNGQALFATLHAGVLHQATDRPATSVLV